jgi:hypothetical protein
MNLLKTIIERLNQRVEVANIFDKQFNLCELNANGNDKAWVHYIGNGQAEVVTNFDAKNGTLFWAKRGKVTVAKTDAYRMSGCKQLYVTTFPLTAYAIVRKSHLPCDAEDAQDWLASRVYKLTSGTDPLFKQSIGVINYEVVPSGYANEIKTLTANYEWACVSVDMDVQVITTTEEGCYDICATGDIPLPDLPACVPCLTEVAVDGVTITGNGTAEDPLVAIGGGGGGGVMTAIAFSTDHLASTGNQYVIGNVVWYNNNIYRCIANNDSLLPTNTTYWTNLGAGFQTIERPIDWDATSGNNQILNKPTIPILPATIVEDVTATAPMSSSGGTNPDISITQANTTTDGYLSSTDWNTFDGKFNVPTGLVTDYLDGLGTPTPFPAIPVGTVTSVNSGTNISVDNTNPAAPIINSLSDRYKTSSVTSNSVSNGSKSFAVDINLSYIPLQEILVVHNPANHMHGEVTSYDATTGALVVNIKTHTGSGTYTSWVLNLDGTPVDAITGSGTTNEIAYFTAARIISSLPVATYPSLTELSYVKGVTSAIQTQINGKQNALGFTPVPDSRSITINGTTQDLTADRTFTIAVPTTYKSGLDTAGYSSAANTAVYTQLIAANTFVAGDVIRVTYRTRKTGNANAQTIRIYVNATADLTGTPILVGQYTVVTATGFYNQMLRHLAIKNVTTNTEVLATATTNAATDIGNLTTAPSTLAINWTANRYFVFAIQSGGATDVNYGSFYSIEKL